jgi:hypothetical protein
MSGRFRAQLQMQTSISVSHEYWKLVTHKKDMYIVWWSSAQMETHHIIFNLLGNNCKSFEFSCSSIECLSYTHFQSIISRLC